MAKLDGLSQAIGAKLHAPGNQGKLWQVVKVLGDLGHEAGPTRPTEPHSALLLRILLFLIRPRLDRTSTARTAPGGSQPDKLMIAPPPALDAVGWPSALWRYNNARDGLARDGHAGTARKRSPQLPTDSSVQQLDWLLWLWPVRDLDMDCPPKRLP